MHWWEKGFTNNDNNNNNNNTILQHSHPLIVRGALNNIKYNNFIAINTQKINKKRQ